MNVSTSSAATIAAASASDVNSTQSKSKTSSSSKSGKSFEDEIKTASKTEKTEETKDSKETEKTSKDDKKVSDKKKASQKDSNKEANKLAEELKTPDDIVPDDVYSGGINFTDFKYHNESQSLLTQNIQDLLNTKNLMSTVNSAQTVDYDAINMSDSDATFFANLVQNTDMSMQSIASQIQTQMAEGSQNIQQNVKVSSVLMEKLSESLKTNQPFRIDFDKDVSVIIKVNKDGSLAANFIPGDKAVEQYLRNNISFLRQRFDEQNLSYSQLSYSNSRQQQQQKRQSKEKQ